MAHYGCVFSKTNSSWVSCQTITKNLYQTYLGLEKQGEVITEFPYYNEMSEFDILNLAHEISQSPISHLCFLDHKPHPLILIELLKQVAPEKFHRLKFVFHLYGDFTLLFLDWFKLKNILKGASVLFFIPSRAQKKLISQFIPEKHLAILPFGYTTIHDFSVESYHHFRQKFGWKNDEKIFLYTGRLSRQKRIIQQILSYARWCQLNPFSRFRFILAGEVDHLGEPWINKAEYLGKYWSQIQQILQQLPSHIQQSIHFLGFQSKNELEKLYMASDVYINLSVHNDEDFGMAPLEALCFGIPCILTSWGGFHDFSLPNRTSVAYVPVKLTAAAKKISRQDVIKAMLKASAHHLSQRKEVANLYRQKYHPQFPVHLLSKALGKTAKLEDFSPLFQRLAMNTIAHNGKPFKKYAKNQFNNDYLKIYQAYVETYE
jgi:glycosyltransferase involved in cell wall biosynthesis